MPETPYTTAFCAKPCADAVRGLYMWVVGKVRPWRLSPPEPKPMTAEVKELLRERALERKREPRRPAAPRSDAGAGIDDKYGPLRAITRIIDERPGKTSYRVEFECGHPGTSPKGAKQRRCYRCRAAATATA